MLIHVDRLPLRFGNWGFAIVMMQTIASLVNFYTLKVDALFLIIFAKYSSKSLFLAFNSFLPNVLLIPQKTSENVCVRIRG